jgi:hypothetical protein
MWGRKRGAEAAGTEQLEGAPAPEEPQRLRDALRKARIESAERSGIVVDLQDAEVARLEFLNEALTPIFAEVPPEIDLFDPGISRGETPRLWIDAIAHVAMGRDKRSYRFVQDTRYGRKVLAESLNIPDIVQAVTKYLAQRLVERERALADTGLAGDHMLPAVQHRTHGRFLAFLLGLVIGIAALFAAAYAFGP